MALLVFAPLARGAIQPWAVTVILLATLVAATALVLGRCLSWQWSWVKTPLDKPIFCLITLSLVSLVFSQHRYTSLWSFFLLLSYIAIYYLVVQAFGTTKQIRRLIYVIIGLAVFLCAFFFIKKSGHNPFSWWDYSHIGLNRELSASSSTYGNPNHFAGFLVMAIPASLGLYMAGARTTIGAVVGLGLTLFLLTALVLSTSRGGWVSGAAGLGFMAAVRMRRLRVNPKRLLYWIVPVTVFLLLVALGNRAVVMDIRSFFAVASDASLLSRATVWKSILAMIADYPLLGVGPGNFALVFTQYQPPVGSVVAVRYLFAHNDYLQFLADAGLPLLVVMGWAGARFYGSGFSKLKHPDRFVRRMTLATMASVSGILVFSLTDFNLHIPANALLFTVLVALTVTPPASSR
ncbi:MAG: O-antigen ligase family protein [Desulfobacterales bacterium]|nr:O-antigen ligase family protein [Desulfobacterales bacterium]